MAETQQPRRPDNLHKSIFNPQLADLCACGMLDPAVPYERDLIQFLVHVCDCSQFSSLVPEPWRYDSEYACCRNLASKEDDIDLLEDYALYGDDAMLRAFAFCRLTGWEHWESNDSYSYRTFGCGRVEGYTRERARELCAQLQDELGDGLPTDSSDPMGAEDVLWEGSYLLAEGMRYGRNFVNEISYVGLCARREAAALGVEREGIEFWLLGILQYAQLDEEELHYIPFPISGPWEARRDLERCREVLARHGIDPLRLERYLRGVLKEGATSDPELLPGYFAAAQRRVDWKYDPFMTTELLQAILAFPTEAICRALMRLGLVMTMEARLPQELRPVIKVPYRSTLFFNRDELEEVDLSVVDTSGTTDLSCMFAGCSDLRAVDLSPLDTAHVTDMSEMFQSCGKLQAIDLSPLDTSRVTTMENMFRGCTSLRSVDLSCLDTSRVTNMDRMFYYCPSLESVDLRGLDTSQVTSIVYLFSSCTSLRSADLSGLDLSHAESIAGLFDYCKSLESVRLPQRELSRAEDLSYLFMDCASLREVDLSGFRAPRARDLSYLFSGCSSLESVDLSVLVTPNAEYASNAFKGCSSLRSFSIPETWPLIDGCELPEPTAENGMWWSRAEGRWMSIHEILARGPMADSFSAEG